MTRIYLKPGDVVTAHFVDLVVIEEAKGCLNYAISRLGNYDIRESDVRYFPDELGCAGLDGFEIKHAWDVDPKDRHYGKPYYER